MPTSDITAEQCRGARALLAMKREDLATASNVAHSTLADFETGRRQPHPRTLDAVRTALELAGIEFIEENGGGPGVRLRKGEA